MTFRNRSNEDYHRKAAHAYAAGSCGYPRRLPSVLLALAAALALLVFGDGGVGQAQASVALAGNFGQPGPNPAPVSQYDFAQAFTTGSNNYGYTLRQIDFQMVVKPVATSAPRITLRSVSTTGTMVAAFGPPLVSVWGLVSYSPIGTVRLASSTEYWMVLDGDSPNVWVERTGSNGEDGVPVGGATIADVGQSRPANSTGSFADMDGGLSLKIRVMGVSANSPARDVTDSRKSATSQMSTSTPTATATAKPPPPAPATPPRPTATLTASPTAAATPTPAPEAAPEQAVPEQAAGPPWWLWLLLVLLASAVAAGGYIYWHTRRGT